MADVRPRGVDLRRGALLVAGSKVGLGIGVLLSGFRALSDDDFARVVLMQEWAAEPRLDPTGSSWLPFPFWLNGGLMRLLGSSLWTARTLAFALGVAAALLVWQAARWLVDDERDALAGGWLAAIFPWSAYLGVATVPELPTAALGVFAAASLTRPLGSARALAGLGLLAACLSRYEAWPLALLFCAFTAWDARPSGTDSARPASRGWALLALGLAALGPLGWMLHNARAHGSALRFAGRVSAYKHALGGAAGSLFDYPIMLLREEPELCIVGMVVWFLRRRLPHGAKFARPLWCMGAVLLSLSVAGLRGGAPTHHAGRVLLPLWLLLAIYVASSLRWCMRRWPQRRAALSLFSVAVMLLGVTVLRPWYARLDGFTSRAAEVAFAEGLARKLKAEPAGTVRHVLLDAHDYGYFAIQAASGDPRLFVIDRSLDPRQPQNASSFGDCDRLLSRILRRDITHLAAPLGEVAAVDQPGTIHLGAPWYRAGGWGAWTFAQAATCR